MPRRLSEAWPVRARLYWCREHNIPLLGRECPSGGHVIEVKLTEPGDARPAFSHDLEVMLRAYRNEVGSSGGFEAFAGSGVKMLNKVPFMDLMYEIISEGTVIGRMYWDPAEGDWRLRFSMPGLLRVWDRDPLPVFHVRGGLKTLRRSRVFKNVYGYKPRVQVALVDDEGQPIGVAYVSDDGEVVKVHTVFWRPRGEREAKPLASTWDDVLKANDYYIYYHWSRAVKFIHVMNEKVGKPVLVSFSGGKDSLVALHLTLETGIRPTLVFNDTGIEMPETYELVDRISREWGLELLVASAGDRFWRAAEKVGPPGKDYRWCCKVSKLAPLARLLLERFPDGALNIVGQRAFESLDRAKSPRVWRNRWIPLILNISPIQEWTQLAVWLYIWKHKLPYNPLYERGFDRIGCFLCPAAFMAEYEFVRETHPELWERWERILWKWASRIGLKGREAEVWARYGLWRWLTPAPQKLRLARRLRLELPPWRETLSKWLSPAIVDHRISENSIYIELDKQIDPRALAEQYTVLGRLRPTDESGGGLRLESDTGVTIELAGSSLSVKGARGVHARELALDSLKLVFRWLNCAGCRACETSCPTEAIKVIEEDGRTRPVVDGSKCIHCKLCLDNCPLADVVADKIYSALILDNPTAWRRSGRRSHESVVERYLKLKGFRVPEEQRAAEVEQDALVSPVALSDEEE